LGSAYQYGHQGDLAGDELIKKVIGIMAGLNKYPAEEFDDFIISACTDVTGFGLIGHACEMIDDKAVGLRLFIESMPFIPEAIEFARMGIVPGGALRNRKYREGQVEGIKNIDPVILDILFDPQTSGGLLVAMGKNQAIDFVSRLRSKGIQDASIIGEFIEDFKGRIVL
jgi:selenide,water dikinase